MLLELPIEYVHQILPFLNVDSYLSPLIEARGHELDYSLFTQSQVSSMFPTSFMEKDESKRRIALLHIDVLNQFLPKMDSGQLRLISRNHLRNSKLSLCTLPADKIRGMFPTSFMEKDDSVRRLNALSRDNYDYVTSIVNFNPSRW